MCSDVLWHCQAYRRYEEALKDWRNHLFSWTRSERKDPVTGDIEYYTKAPSDNNGVTGRWSPLFAAFQNEGVRGEGEGEGEGVEVVGVEGEADDAGDRTQSDVEVVPL